MYDVGIYENVKMEKTVKENENRYERQICMEDIGEEGQRKLQNAKVLVVGAGGLGSPALLYLACAGVGTIGILDGDVVSISNLNRQIIHGEKQIGVSKAESAKQTLKEINSEIKVITYEQWLTKQNAKSILEEYDFVLDCVDNYKTKFLINDVCVELEKPFCHGGVYKYEGQVMTYVKGRGPCFRCIFEEEPGEGEYNNPSVVGTLGAVAGVIGSIEAMEAIKYIVGKGELLTKKMFVFDGIHAKSRIVNIPNVNPQCKCCTTF